MRVAWDRLVEIDKKLTAAMLGFEQARGLRPGAGQLGHDEHGEVEENAEEGVWREYERTHRALKTVYSTAGTAITFADGVARVIADRAKTASMLLEIMENVKGLKERWSFPVASQSGNGNVTED
ncbi:hypothetical protein MMC18_009529 [Xylographa bjoerkii]|nr:hypothetical protein [Xylographa bjoerkii]